MGTVDIFITKADKIDLPRILTLQKQCYHAEALLYDDFDIPPLKQDIDSLNQEYDVGIVLKACIAEEIVGSVRAYIKEGVCYIGKLIVREDQQNQGIGKKLMEKIEKAFDNCIRYELFTGFKSDKNLYLYKKLGYRQFREEKINEKLSLVFLQKDNPIKI